MFEFVNREQLTSEDYREYGVDANNAAEDIEQVYRILANTEQQINRNEQTLTYNKKNA